MKRDITFRKFNSSHIIILLLLSTASFSAITKNKTDIIAFGKFSNTEALDVSITAISDDVYTVTYTNSTKNHQTKIALGVRSGSQINFYGETALFGEKHITNIQTIALNPNLVVAVGKLARSGKQYPYLSTVYVNLFERKPVIIKTKQLEEVKTSFDKFAISCINAYRLSLVYYTLMNDTKGTRELYVTEVNIDQYGFHTSKPICVHRGKINDISACGFGEESKTSKTTTSNNSMVLAYNTDIKGGAGYILTVGMNGYEVDKNKISSPEAFTEFMGSVSITNISNQDFIVAYSDLDKGIRVQSGKVKDEKYVVISDYSVPVSDAICPDAVVTGINEDAFIATTQNRRRDGIQNFLGAIDDNHQIQFTQINSVQAGTMNSLSVDRPKQPKICHYGFAYGSKDCGEMFIARLPSKYENERYQYFQSMDMKSWIGSMHNIKERRGEQK